MKKLVLSLIALLIIVGFARVSLKFEAVQNVALDRIAAIFASSGGGTPPSVEDGLHVFVCGSASPLGATEQAQACIAVVTPEHFYIIDAGAGSTANVTGAGLPMVRLQGILLTHFHSDHIAEIYEMNLNSWVQGRPQPLKIIGPSGVAEVSDAVNAGYRMDRQYRVEHHGSALLAPELGVLSETTLDADSVYTDGALKITAYRASHDPVEPAVGYRFDYKGRSVVISGDSNVVEATYQIADGADLLLHDALSVPIVASLADAAASAGMDRIAKIMNDVIDYHASTSSLVELGESSNVGMVAFYHLVPVPANIVMEEIFRRDLPDNFVIARDGMWFDLPVDSEEILISSD